MDERKKTGELPRLLLAAAHSGSGKTMLTMGILAALARRGIPLAAFKSGPDYIDPMFHSRVLGIPARNLDGYFTDADTLRMLFSRSAAGAGGLSLIEGAMGYFDGAGLGGMQASACELAQTLSAPVVLVVDAAGMSLSAAAVLQGFLSFVTPSQIRGVIFNRMSKAVYDAVRPQVEAMGVRACGYLPRLRGMELESRHLGLVTPQEMQALRAYTERLADAVEQTVDLDALLTLAKGAPALSWREQRLPRLREPLTVAVARDRAFCFLYEDNLDYLRALGAKIRFFSPLSDARLPEHTDVVLLSGGYPELYARELSENEAMRKTIRQAYADGVYILAECGGFLYLGQTLESMDGAVYPMCGVLSGQGFRTERLQRFGYIELTPQGGGTAVRGHEFHYFDSTDNGAAMHAKKPYRETAWDCMHASEHLLAGFPHLSYYSAPSFLYERLERYTAYRREKKEA